MKQYTSQTNLFFKEVTKLVDPVIEEILASHADRETQKLLNYSIKAGGKRLRPALAIICSRMLGGKLRDVLRPAAGLEILHNYTLIIDDIIDNSLTRRGKSTLWAKFGKSIAQCLGMDYSAAIFQAANFSKYSSQILKLFAKTLKRITDGQILDILLEQKGKEDEKYIVQNRRLKIIFSDYLKMIGMKTAFFVQASCQTGGISANARPNQLKALGEYGFNIGLAFQIKDDILDIYGEGKKFGKKIGGDIKERKLGNILIFFTIKELPPQKRKRFLFILKAMKIKERDIGEAVKLIKETSARQKAILLGKRYAEKAKGKLKNMPQNKWSQMLKEIADFTIERSK